MRRIILLCATALIAMTPAHAQQAEPGPAKPLLQNEQIDVKELRLRPGEKLPARDHPNSFVYALTDGALVFTHPGKTPYEMTFKAGEALWLPSQSAATANETAKEVRVLVVEIKQRAAAARAKKAPAKKAAPAKKGSSAAKAKPKS